MNDDLRKLEKIILNMRPNGIIQSQIVDALKAILWIFQQQDKPEIQTKLDQVITEIKYAKKDSPPVAPSAITKST